MTRLEQLVNDSERLANRSKAIYSAAVRSFVAYAGADERRWQPTLVKAWRDSLADVAPQTANTMLRGLRFAFRRYHAMQYGPDAASPIEYRREGDATRKPEALTAAQAKKLLQTVDLDTTLAGRRDHVILCLGIYEGLRREEMVGLLWRHVGDDRLIQFLRKGGHLSDHPLNTRTIDAINALLSVLPLAQKRLNVPVLQRLRNCIGCGVASLSTNGIYAIVAMRAKQAGLRVAPHELRHTCGSLALQSGVPTWRVAKHLDHASEVTTIRTYAHDLPAKEGDPVGRSIAELLEGNDGE